MDCPHGPNVITRFLIRERGRQNSDKKKKLTVETGWIMHSEDGRRLLRNAGSLYKLEKTRKHSPLESPEGAEPYQQLDFLTSRTTR